MDELDAMRAVDTAALWLAVTMWGSLIVGMGVLLVCDLTGVWHYDPEKWKRQARKKRVRAAKKMDIGEGVTLQRGVRACFKEKGMWGTPDDKGTVAVMTGLGDVRASMFVYPETGRIEVLSFKRRGSWADEKERAALVGLMVDVAKGRAKRPQP